MNPLVVVAVLTVLVAGFVAADYIADAWNRRRRARLDLDARRAAALAALARAARNTDPLDRGRIRVADTLLLAVVAALPFVAATDLRPTSTVNALPDVHVSTAAAVLPRTAAATPAPSSPDPHPPAGSGPTVGPCAASWYGGGEPLNRHTANGDVFDPDGFTVAAWHLPFGTVLDVTAGTRTVRVTVNDRGPARRLNRCLDLSRAAFAEIAPLDAGVVTVTYREVTP